MAATLTANISSTDRRFTASEAISGLTQGNLLRIGDELIEFTYYQTPRKPSLLDEAKLVVTRGVLGTTKASHLSGAAVLGVQLAVVTSEDDSSPDPFGGGGGGVTVTVPPAAAVPVTNFNMPGATIAEGTATVLTPSILGPFSVSGTDAALAADWVVLAALPEGIIVQQVFVFCSVSFVDTGRLQVYAGDVGVSGGTIWTAGTSPGPEASGGTTPRANPSQPSSNYNEIAGGAVLTGPNASIYATIDSEGSAGAADIYVAIATPAS